MTPPVPVPGWLKVVLILIVVGVLVLAFMLYNINSHMAIMDAKGRNLREWARVTAVWADHVNADHLSEDHTKMKVAPSHISPPPNPPPEW